MGETLAKGLRTLGIEAEICFAYGGPGPVGEAAGVPCHYLGLRSSQDFFRWPRVRNLMRTLKPQIVHFVDPLFWMHLASLGKSFKKVVHVHGGEFLTQGLLSDRLRWGFLRSRADLFVCITEGARRALVSLNLASASRTSVVYNGIDFDWFQDRPTREAARAKLGLPYDALVIGMVCRLFRARRCDELLRILTMLEPRWRALLVGDGAERPKLERFAETLGVRNRVRFTGCLEDVRLAYSAMDTFAFLALYDSFGLAIAEAMACKVPVFGLGGAGEYREPENPLVTPDNSTFVERSHPGDYHREEDPSVLRNLADCITDFGLHPERYSKRTDRAHQHVQKRFDVARQAKTMYGLYLGLIRGEQPPGQTR